MKNVYILLIALFFILLCLIWITQDLWDRATNEIIKIVEQNTNVHEDIENNILEVA